MHYSGNRLEAEAEHYLSQNLSNKNSLNIESNENHRPFTYFPHLSNESLKSLSQQDFHFLSSTLKHIFIGITQGYTLNIELNGIGYNATISENTHQSKETHRYKKGESMDKIEYLDSLFFATNFFLEKYHVSSTHSRFPFNKLLPCEKPLTSIKENKLFSLLPCSKILNLSLGYSHQIQYEIPENHVFITCRTSTDSNLTNLLTLFGISKNILTQIAANIYKIKKPDSYKGQGIRYDGLHLFLKNQKKRK